MSNVENLREKETKRTVLIRIIKRKLVEISGTSQRHGKTLIKLSNEFV